MQKRSTHLLSCRRRSHTLIDRARRAFRPVAAFLLRAALVALFLLFVAQTWADPDLWGHVKFGGDIAAAGLHRTDPYSFGSDRPWINHEWLAELIMNGAWELLGGAGLIVAKTAVVVSAIAFVLAALNGVQMGPPLRLLLVFTIVAGMWARIYVFRPQVFSLVLFAALIWVLKCAEASHRRLLWLAPLLFLLWVNLHGGWIVGLAALALWSVLNLTPFRSASIPAGHMVLVVALAALATLVNPYGVGMWEFILETVRLDRATISDWQPLLNTGAGKLVAWGAAAILSALALFHRRPAVPLSHAILVVGLGAAALKVSRLDAFFSLAAVMLLAPQIADFSGEGRLRKARTPRPLLWASAAVTGCLAVGLLSPQRFSCVRLDGPWMPEREAISWIRASGVHGRLLTWFDWGEYAIWHLAPDVRVSFDGRRETVYSASYISRHTDLYFKPDTQREFLQSLDVDHAWLSRDLPLVAALEGDGWTRVAAGPRSVLLERGARRIVEAAPVAAPACFPGP